MRMDLFDLGTNRHRIGEVSTRRVRQRLTVRCKSLRP